MPRDYLYISDRKVANIVRDEDLPPDVRKRSFKAGLSFGIELGAEVGAERRRSDSRQHAVELAEQILERSGALVGPLDADEEPEWCRWRMPMCRGWQLHGVPGMWFSGVLDRVAIVLAGSQVHSMGPRAEDENGLWMSDLPDQLRVLQEIEEHALDLDVGADGLAAAIGVACGSWGGVSQNLEFTARIDKIYRQPELGEIQGDDDPFERLLLGSPLYVAQVW